MKKPTPKKDHAREQAAEEGAPSTLFGAVRGWVLHEGDLVSSIGARWDADRRLLDHSPTQPPR